VIVRISGEGQYEVADGDMTRLNELDNAVVAAVEAGDEARFGDTFSALIAFVHERGSALADDDLRPSDVIFPPGDLTLAEAAQDFSGEGLIPD
jgi:hypothetical protein